MTGLSLFRDCCVTVPNFTRVFAVIHPRPEDQADVLVDHAVFNQTHIDRLMARKLTYMASFRHPVSWFISAVQYYHVDDEKVSICKQDISLLLVQTILVS